jgi:hypothetical protein
MGVSAFLYRYAYTPPPLQEYSTLKASQTFHALRGTHLKDMGVQVVNNVLYGCVEHCVLTRPNRVSTIRSHPLCPMYGMPSFKCSPTLAPDKEGKRAHCVLRAV